MATVGNLFVNVRGRTSGLVRDMKKANRKVSKDFYRNESLARQQYTQAIGRVQAARGMSPAVRDKRLREADVARRRLLIAQGRPERLARRRELMQRKGRFREAASMFAASPLGQVTTVLGVLGISLSAFKMATNAFIASAKRGAALTERFKYAGPEGGRVAQTEAFKIQQQLAFAQNPQISAAKLRRTRSEAMLEGTEMQLSAATDNLIALFTEFYSFFLRGGFAGGGMSARALMEHRFQKDLIEHQTGLTGQGP
jgi:hypothetical protein